MKPLEPYVWGAWEMVTSSHEYAKLASNLIEYTIIVPADSIMKVEFEYIIDRRTEVFNAWLKHRYDLIFMDCQMPVMDGYESTKKIRQAEEGENRTTIIAMTAYAMEGDKDKCISAGMDEYLAKPIDFDQMVDYIEGICKKKNNTEVNLLDSFKIAFMEKSRFNQEEADDIFSDFSKLFVEHIEGLEKGLSSFDYEQIQKIAHQLKGESANLRIDPIMKLAERLDISSRSAQENTIREAIEELIKYKEIFECEVL